jgi:lipopolysaccharide transport system permease protein
VGVRAATAGELGLHGPGPSQTIVIRPSRGWVPIQLGELWAYRELLYFLVWRDVKIRYKQTVFGAGWALLQPFLMMVVFTVFIGRVANLHYSAPYPIVVYAGLVPWTLFAGSLSGVSQSLVGSANLVQKVYFPRLILPIAAVGAFVVDCLIAMLLIGVLMFHYGITPRWEIVLLPLFTIMAVFAAISVGIWLAALNVRYRDVRYIVPFMIQLGLFVSPVAYQTDSVPSGLFRTIYSLNPMAGVIQGFRWALIGTERPTALIGVSLAAVVILLTSGMYYFRRVEKTFADVV